MQEDSSQEKPSGNDEVTLVDILAVFLRYRRMICLFTALALLLAILAVVLIPAFALKQATTTQLFEAVITTRISNSVLGFVQQDLVEDFLQQSLTDPTIILAALRDAGINKIDSFNLAEQNEDHLLFAVRRRLVENKAVDGTTLNNKERFYTVEKARGGFRIIIKYHDPLLAKQFLWALIQQTNERMADLLFSMAETEIYNFEKITELEYSREVIEQNLFGAFYRYTAASRFIDGKDPTLAVIQDPYVLIQNANLTMIRSRIIKISVFGVIVVLFMSIFFAFILQWISVIRADAGAMAKLRQAMAGKKR